MNRFDRACARCSASAGVRLTGRAGRRCVILVALIALGSGMAQGAHGDPEQVTTRRFEHVDRGVVFTGGWIPVAASASQLTQPGSGQEGTDGGVASRSGFMTRAPIRLTSSWRSLTPGAQARFTFIGPSITWIGTRTPATGIARVYVDGELEAEVDTFSLTEEIGVPMFTVNDLSDGHHTITIEATGRMSGAAAEAWVCVGGFDVPAAALSRLQETDPAIAFSDGWARVDTPDRSWSAGAAALSETPGAQVTFDFSGTSIAWIGGRSPQTGIARVSLDGAAAVEVDTYAAVEQVQVDVFSATGLANGPHRLTVEVTGQRNPSSSAALIVVDAFEVIAPGRRYQDTDPSVVFAPVSDWYLGNQDRAFSEGTVAESITAGSTAVFSFTGTGVSFVGGRGPQTGIIRVSVDLGPAVEIDLYSPTEAPQKTVFTAAGLAAGAHTLTVEVTGRKNPLAVYYWVVVDAFDVIP